MCGLYMWFVGGSFNVYHLFVSECRVVSECSTHTPTHTHTYTHTYMRTQSQCMYEHSIHHA